MSDSVGVALKQIADRLDDSPELQHVIGGAAKRGALDTIEATVGADRMLSGLKRRAKLGAGYELGSPMILSFRPKGLTILVDQGRKRSGEILPRKRRAVRTRPGHDGLRARSSYGPSAGKRLISRSLSTIAPEVERDLARGIERLIGD